MWYNTIGEAFLPLAFKFASQVDPKAQLFYNDYNLEYNGAKTDGAQRIVKLIQSHGVKINGVGFRAHMTSEPTTSSGGGVTPSQQVLSAALRRMTSQDVDVAYTEIDVRMNLPATQKKLNVQAKVYQRIAASCLAVERCIGMTIWVSQRDNWIQSIVLMSQSGCFRQVLVDPSRFRRRRCCQLVGRGLQEEASLRRLPSWYPPRRKQWCFSLESISFQASMRVYELVEFLLCAYHLILTRA